MDVEQILSEIKVFASNVNNLLGMPMKFTTGHVEILSETISAIEQLQARVEELEGGDCKNTPNCQGYEPTKGATDER